MEKTDPPNNISHAAPAKAAEMQRAMALWLLFVAALVFAMAIIGAITRLTESGLSMVEWRPLIGVLPPLDVAEWQRVFALYQQTPEFRLHNFWMTLEDFKTIFWWEWVHRLWGHLIGLAYVLPLLYFWVRGQVQGWLRPRLLWLLALGFSQGVVGAIMVDSGLVDEPRVSPYKLAMHLSLALFLFSLLLATALRLLSPRQPKSLLPGLNRGCRGHGVASLGFLALTILWGAFVAGMDAGLVYNSWPLMNEEFLPQEAFNMQPLWLNATENAAMVQFIHRWLGMLTGIMLLAFAVILSIKIKNLPEKALKRAAFALAAFSLLQPILGIKLLIFQVPIWAGALHQAMAMILLGLLLFCLHSMQIRENIKNQ